MRTLTFIIIGIFCLNLHSQNIGIESVASGFSSPVNIKHAGDARLFVVEQPGRIKIINSDESVNPVPFLDINTRVIDGGGESGLLGLAFHPNYVANGYFYLNYINNSGDTVISRFSRSASDSNIADNTSEFILMTIVQPYGNHNGGDLAFGPDGYLYIALGDGGSGGDPGDRAQNINTLLGKMLRIDVDNPSNGNNYGIPTSGNYFESNPGASQEIWSVGLRNPWKFSFDKATNDLWIADVGQDNIEEINMVAPNSSNINYGWRCYEGNNAYNLNGNCPATNTLTFPVAQYTHFNSGQFKCSVTGGYRYRGTAQPNLIGLYFFADYCSNEIGTLEGPGPNWNMVLSQQFNGNNWSAFGEDVNGELYICGLSSGTVYRIIDANLGVDDHEIFEISIYPNPTNEGFTLDLMESNIAIEVVNIFNIHGQLVTTISSFEDQTIAIPTKYLASGLYLVEVINVKGHKKIKKLIKS